jgi:uncharacterized protein YcnI
MRTALERLVVGLISTVFASIAAAHVVVSPRTSSPGAYEKYTVRVPTEGKVTTTSVEVVLPAEVTFLAVSAPVGYTYEIRKTGERVTSIVWKMEIKPEEFAEFAFMARNPQQGISLTWKAVQRFADGTSTEWSGPAGDKHPASVTSLSAADAGHAH